MSAPSTTARPPHTLIVGGTGMLRDLCLSLALRGHAVSVIAQNPDRLNALKTDAARHGKVIHPLPVDYGHAVQLESRIRAAESLHGPISLAVCWVHGDSPQALPTIANCLKNRPKNGAQGEPSPKLFHLISSGDTRPAIRAAIERLTKDFPSIAWRRVLLGFKFKQSGSRWLTHEEIWQGTLAAIDNDWTESVIGVVTPWEKRPE